MNKSGGFLLVIALLSVICCPAGADCVEGALTNTSFSRLNNHTIALTGGYEGAIVIKTPCRIKRNSVISILQDSFCDSDEAVLNVDGIECAAEKVDKDDKFNDQRLSEEYNWDYRVD